jgi:hypothetical protein
LCLEAHPSIIELNSNSKQTQERLSGYDDKLQKLLHSSDELDNQVRDEIISLKNEAEISLLKSKNSLLTTHNIPNIIKSIKTLLNKRKDPIDSLTDFPFRKLFSKARVYGRDKIELIINPFQTTYETSIYVFPDIETEYLIRKTKHKIHSRIIVY